jgi:DUF971 family protein
MQSPSNITLNSAKNLLTLTFKDIKYPLTAEYLRVYSPSAEVVGHSIGQEVLQIDKANVHIEKIEPTGNYAVVLFFSDGHDSGIYSWDYLYKIATEKEALWADYLQRLQSSGHNHNEL